MKNAHCTESLTQRPPTKAAYCLAVKHWGLHLRSATLSACLALSSPHLLAQKETEAQTPANAVPPTEEPAQTTEPETPIYSSREERDMKLLAQDVEDETAVWLTALDQRFLALYEPELTGQAVGAVLIINAAGQHSSWPTTSERIRLSLPEFGWNTLSTELPMPEASPIPKRSKPTPTGTEDSEQSTEEASDTENKETQTETVEAEKGEDKEIYDENTDGLSDGSVNAEDPNQTALPPEGAPPKASPEEISIQRLHAAINYLHQQGQFNIVLMGSGVGALRSVCFLKEIPKVNEATQARLIRSLVMIDARNRLPHDDRQLHKCLDTPDMPVLDVYVGQDDRNSVEAKERRKYAHRKNYATYQQLRLPEMARNTMLGENRLSRRIRGFLENHARGVKVDNAIIKNP